jgi:nucleolin
MSMNSLYENSITTGDKEIFFDILESKLGLYVNIADKKRQNGNSVKVSLDALPEFISALNKAATAGKKLKSGEKVKTSNDKPRSEPRERKPLPPKPENPVTDIARSVFVSDLAYETTEVELRQHFSKVGRVTTVFFHTRFRKGKSVSRGSGVVEFSTPAEAARAIAELDGTTLDGREIRCRVDRPVEERPVTERKARETTAAEAEPRQPREPREKKERKPVDRTGETADPSKVFVGNLSFDSTEESLTKVFGAIGDVVKVEIPRSRKGRGGGSAVVEFADSEDAQSAIDRLDGRDIDGRQVSVRAYYIN